MRLIGPYAGTMIAKLLYIFLAAKAVGMVLDGRWHLSQADLPLERASILRYFYLLPLAFFASLVALGLAAFWPSGRMGVAAPLTCMSTA